ADTDGNNPVGKPQNTWDPAGNVTEIKHTNASNTTLEDFTYQYSPGDLVTSETDTINGTPTTTNYTYDVSNQLTGANSSTYSWDANGNATNTGDQVSPANQLTSDGTWNYVFDPVGDMVQKTGVSGGSQSGVQWVYGFDNAHHLASASKYVSGVLQVQETNIYDVYGNRVEEDITQGGSTTVT